MKFNGLLSNIKCSAYIASLSDVSMSSSGEMARNEKFTLTRLREFTLFNYESYCAQGEEFRHRLSGAALHALNLTDIWWTDCESRTEWGGVFPVHLRLMHRDNKHVVIDVMSTGGESPFWHGLMWLHPDHTGLYFWNCEVLNGFQAGGAEE